MNILLAFVIVAVVAAVVWAVYARMIDGDSDIKSYSQCVAAGNPVQESYPEVCVTKDGRRYTNPAAEAQQPVQNNGN